jgi:hypothetical protein
VGRVPRFLNCLLLSLVTARQNARFSKKEEETEREGGRAKKKKARINNNNSNAHAVSVCVCVVHLPHPSSLCLAANQPDLHTPVTASVSLSLYIRNCNCTCFRAWIIVLFAFSSSVREKDLYHAVHCFHSFLLRSASTEQRKAVSSKQRGKEEEGAAMRTVAFTRISQLWFLI